MAAKIYETGVFKQENTTDKDIIFDEDYLSKQYMKDISGFELLKDQNSLARQAKNGDKAAREKLIVHNLRLVVAVAHKFNDNTLISFMDRIALGNQALIRAVDNYDPDKGYALSTYATSCIEKTIKKAISAATDIRLPEDKRWAVFNVERFDSIYRAENGMSPDVEEVMAGTDLSEKEVIKAYTLLNRIKTISLDKPVGNESDDKDRTLQDELDSNERLEEEIINRITLHNQLKSCLSTLQYNVVVMKLGILDGIMMTDTEIAKALGKTARQIHYAYINAVKILKNDDFHNFLCHYAA